MSDTKKAIIFSLLGFFCFSFGDALRKVVLISFGAAEVQLWSCSASLIVVLLASNQVGGIKSLKHITKPHIHFIRAILITVVISCSVFALERLTLDVFYTLVFTIPMITSLLACIFFGERLSLTKLFLISFGFLGVIVIARPGSDIDMVGVVLALILALSASTNFLLNKLFRADEAKFPFGFFPYVLAVSVFLFVNRGVYPDLGAVNIALCFMAGAGSVLGVIASVYAFQLARAAVAVPYQYTQLVWGLIFGFILFGDVPDLLVMIGAGIIITSGMMLYFHDTKSEMDDT